MNICRVSESLKLLSHVISNQASKINDNHKSSQAKYTMPEYDWQVSAAQDIFHFCVKTLILNTLNIKCTTAFQKEKQTKKLNPQLAEMATVSICLLNRISNYVFTWLFQSAGRKARRVDHSSEFQPHLQSFGRSKIQSRAHQGSLLTASSGSTACTSLLWLAGQPVGKCSLL